MNWKCGLASIIVIYNNDYKVQETRNIIYKQTKGEIHVYNKWHVHIIT